MGCKQSGFTDAQHQCSSHRLAENMLKFQSVREVVGPTSIFNGGGGPTFRVSQYCHAVVEDTGIIAYICTSLTGTRRRFWLLFVFIAASRGYLKCHISDVQYMPLECF